MQNNKRQMTTLCQQAKALKKYSGLCLYRPFVNHHFRAYMETPIFIDESQLIIGQPDKVVYEDTQNLQSCAWCSIYTSLSTSIFGSK